MRKKINTITKLKQILNLLLLPQDWIQFLSNLLLHHPKNKRLNKVHNPFQNPIADQFPL